MELHFWFSSNTNGLSWLFFSLWLLSLKKMNEVSWTINALKRVFCLHHISMEISKKEPRLRQS